MKIYHLYVDAAVQGSKDLQCTVTPKVHLMLEHVEWQMRNIQGVLSDKMEDWVERLHQTKKRERLRYCIVQNPIICSLAREKANSRNMHPDVIVQTDKINEGNRQNLVESKAALWGHCKKGSVMLGGTRPCNISCRTSPRDSPGWPHCSTMGRWIHTAAKNAKILCHLVKELGNTKL